jgi:hypothetical protein
MKRSLITVVLSIATLTSCSTVPTTSVVGVRYDGLYCGYNRAESPLTTYYLRFYPDGAVVAVSSTGRPPDVARWLSREDPQACRGQYHITDRAIRFTTRGLLCAEDYSGTVSPSELMLRSHSRQNGYEVILAYKFVSTAFLR